jgi:hypothetical protein
VDCCRRRVPRWMRLHQSSACGPCTPVPFSNRDRQDGHPEAGGCRSLGGDLASILGRRGSVSRKAPLPIRSRLLWLVLFLGPQENAPFKGQTPGFRYPVLPNKQRLLGPGAGTDNGARDARAGAGPRGPRSSWAGSSLQAPGTLLSSQRSADSFQGQDNGRTTCTVRWTQLFLY